LESTIKLAPDFPDNYLTLLEAYLKWNDREAASSTAERYKKILSSARMKYGGKEWESAWRDWDRRWSEIESRMRE